MKKADFWIVGTFFLITVFHYVDTAISGDGHLLCLSLAYLAGFSISLFMTRNSKVCNLIYLTYSFILCVAIILSFLPALLMDNKAMSLIFYLSAVLIEPFISLAAFIWGDTDPLSMIFGIVLVYLFPFVTTGISFHFYTKNKCEQKEPGSV